LHSISSFSSTRVPFSTLWANLIMNCALYPTLQRSRRIVSPNLTSSFELGKFPIPWFFLLVALFCPRFLLVLHCFFLFDRGPLLSCNWSSHRDLTMFRVLPHLLTTKCMIQSILSNKLNIIYQISRSVSSVHNFIIYDELHTL